MTDGLSTTVLKARLRWWLATVDKTNEGTAASRRIALAAQSALGKFQVRVLQFTYPVRLETTRSLSSSENTR